MNRRWLLFSACLLAALWFAFHVHRYRGASAPQTHTGNTQSSTKNAYSGLRSLVLEGSRANFGLGPGSRSAQPFALVTDIGTPQGPTTVVAIADGSASVYLSNGGGLVGGGQSHASIRDAALKAVALADGVQPAMHRATVYPVAQSGQITFYAVTDEGVFAASISKDEVDSHRSPFSQLGDSAQAIITEYERAGKTQ